MSIVIIMICALGRAKDAYRCLIQHKNVRRLEQRAG
jgi:hypothetical protein